MKKDVTQSSSATVTMPGDRFLFSPVKTLLLVLDALLPFPSPRGTHSIRARSLPLTTSDIFIPADKKGIVE